MFQRRFSVQWGSSGGVSARVLRGGLGALIFPLQAPADSRGCLHLRWKHLMRSLGNARLKLSASLEQVVVKEHTQAPQ